MIIDTTKRTVLTGIIGASCFGLNFSHVLAGNESPATATPPTASQPGLSNAPDASDPVIARGKGFEIKRSSLNAALAIYDAGVANDGRSPMDSREAAKTKLLNHIIDTEILMGRATDDEKKEATKQAEATVTHSKERFESEGDFNDWLKTMGMGLQQYRQRIIENYACGMVIDRELAPKANITDDVVKKYYQDHSKIFTKREQCRGSQIYISTLDPQTQKPLPEDKAKKKEKLAKEIKARLDNGEDFFKLLKEFTDKKLERDSNEKDEIIYFPGQMPPEFEAVAFTIETNKISEVIRTRLGYHILRISKREPASELPFEEVAERLKGALVDREVKKLMPAYLENLKKEAAVEIVGSEVKPGREISQRPANTNGILNDTCKTK